MYYRAALVIITRKTVNVSYLKQLKWKLSQNVFFCPKLLYLQKTLQKIKKENKTVFITGDFNYNVLNSGND